MYAIIRTGGKQYRVEVGDVVRVEKLQAEPGSELHLTDVLAVGGEHPLIGDPNVKNAKVTVVVTRQAKAPKLIVFKKKRRQGYRKMQGHRQLYTEVFVKAIHTADGKIEADTEAKVYSIEDKQVRVDQLQDWRDRQKQNKEPESTVAAAPAPAKKKVAKKSVKKASSASKPRKKTVKKSATAGKKTKKKSSK